MAPMAGSSPPALAAAVGQAGGLGACGALSLDAQGIAQWAARLRQMTDAPFQINLWIPDAAPRRDPVAEADQAAFLSRFGPETAPPTGPVLQDFDQQFAALLAARPAAASSIMGLFAPEQVRALKAAGISWIATATSLAEALAAEAAGADAIVAQGAEAGGHRGAFSPAEAARIAVGTFALVPSMADAVSVPVIAAGGIGDARGIASALTLGASAVTLGSALLRTPEAGIDPVWADRLATARPEDSVISTAYTGRPARMLPNAFTRAAHAPGAAPIAPYPIQRALTEPLRKEALARGDAETLYALAGQAAHLSRAEPAQALVSRLWAEAQGLLR